ncbi:MAG: F0F1 ATP synthase subunit epsilon [Nitrospinae bacterium]|nr:F0F1 ATP synthase subunit epsilon [Nitrospinota bacterium]
MMEQSLLLSIVTPERLMVSDKVDQVNVPGSEGDLGVLYDHAPLLTAMRPGLLSYQKGSETIYLVVSGGYLEVTDNRVTVLADTAEFLNEIDRKRAEEAKARAEALLTKPDLSEEEFRKAQKKLFRAVARLESADLKK